MRFCFIIEEAYRHDPMPMTVADQLLQWEQGRAVPSGPARAFLTVIDREPEAVRRALMKRDAS